MMMTRLIGSTWQRRHSQKTGAVVDSATSTSSNKYPTLFANIMHSSAIYFLLKRQRKLAHRWRPQRWSDSHTTSQPAINLANSSRQHISIRGSFKQLCCLLYTMYSVHQSWIPIYAYCTVIHIQITAEIHQLFHRLPTSVMKYSSICIIPSHWQISDIFRWQLHRQRLYDSIGRHLVRSRCNNTGSETSLSFDRTALQAA